MHVIRRGNNRGAIVADDVDCDVLLRFIRTAAGLVGVSVHAYTLMTTHYHLIVTPLEEDALMRMMKMVGEDYVRYFNRRHSRVGTLWTGRYRSIPLTDPLYWLTCLRYVEQNAWRAKMVTAPEHYRWSSYRVHAFGEPSDWLDPHDVYMQLGATALERQAAYRAICAEPLTEIELAGQRYPVRYRRKKVSALASASDAALTGCPTRLRHVSETPLTGV
jgi:putative transposase